MLVDPFLNFNVPPPLVLEFVAVFSRCEFAMKQGEYRRDVRGVASAAWRTLAAGAGEWLQVPEGSRLAAAVQLLLEKPPKLQGFHGSWDEPALPGNNSVERAVNAAVQVRHNLFHGGKHHPSVGDRDTRLVESALILLKAVIEAEPGQLKEDYNVG